ncbi:1,2-dihydroxy-3-keto-5-methylthiopentene dioxygenase [Streptomyces luteolus]|uniref:Acireductone dioxygenase n=1 Tax=Streptomyces luteolus TaxID=3043615 RepID=A0ABT6SYX1_9ACTN|nr:cupin [Streptomyces sp. B-S-A12]MDI3419847.1 cupin [Streptomyces sp. B-S-A12]
MTLLQVMPQDSPEQVELRTRDAARIGTELQALGVEYGHWDLRTEVTAETTPEDLLTAYRSEADALCERDGHVLVDVVQLHPAPGPEWEARAAKARSAFLEEHRHTEDEVRFFAHGTGCFYLHSGSTVYAVVCEAGDLLSVPAGTRHWFDMGARPEFAALRFFKEEDGWVGHFTENPIARHFPRLDALLAGSR